MQIFNHLTFFPKFSHFPHLYELLIAMCELMKNIQTEIDNHTDIEYLNI